VQHRLPLINSSQCACEYKRTWFSPDILSLFHYVTFSNSFDFQQFPFNMSGITTPSSTLVPSHQIVNTIRMFIQGSLKLELPPDMQASIIAPLLSTVNQWSTQIPLLIEGTGFPSSVNLVFAICKDLFIGPAHNKTSFGMEVSKLPTPFQEFSSFIHKLIEAQHIEKEKPIPKVHCTQSFIPSRHFSNGHTLCPACTPSWTHH
jgi:hypothetical protein